LVSRRGLASAGTAAASALPLGLVPGLVVDERWMRAALDDLAVALYVPDVDLRAE
jgi:hypothetical protein